MKHDIKTDCGIISKLSENDWFFSNDHVGLTEYIRFESGNRNAVAPGDDRWVPEETYDPSPWCNCGECYPSEGPPTCIRQD